MYDLSKSGKWWLPVKPEKQFHGKLNFNRTAGGALVLSDTFDRLWDFPRDKQDFLLLGDVTDDGKVTKVSIIISRIPNRQENENSITIILKPRFIFLGVHIKDQNYIEFDKIFLSFVNLDRWISPLHDLIPEPDNGWGYHSSWITVNHECKIRITAHPRTRKNGSKRVKENNIRFEIESLGDKSFDTYLDLEGKLRDFLNFVINDGVALQSFEGFLNDGHDSGPCQFLFHSLVKEKMHKVIVKSPYLFHYWDESHRIEDILNRWFGLYAENEVIMNLYFGVMYNTESYASNNFLMLFTALEAYHGAFLNENSSKKEHKQLLFNAYYEKIDRSDLSEDDKEELKKWVRQKGQLVAKEKIEEIYEQFEDILPHLSTKIGNKTDFIDKIREYRNIMTHGSRKFATIDNEDLFWRYKNLQLILQLCILSRIGFDNEQIRKIYLLDKITKPQ